MKRLGKKSPSGEEALRLAQQAASEVRAYYDARLAKGGLLLDQYEEDAWMQAKTVVDEIEKLKLIYGRGLTFAEAALVMEEQDSADA